MRLRGDLILAALLTMGIAMTGASAGVFNRRASWTFCIVGLVLSLLLIAAAVTEGRSNLN